MIIINQDKDKIYNYEECYFIEIQNCFITKDNKSLDGFKLTIEYPSGISKVLGKYSTKEKAILVLNKLYVSILSSSLEVNCGYRMPQDDEVE